jgi:hypothetical protein
MVYDPAVDGLLDLYADTGSYVMMLLPTFVTFPPVIISFQSTRRYYSRHQRVLFTAHMRCLAVLNTNNNVYEHINSGRVFLLGVNEQDVLDTVHSIQFNHYDLFVHVLRIHRMIHQERVLLSTLAKYIRSMVTCMLIIILTRRVSTNTFNHLHLLFYISLLV